jgi:hypothetical protein
MASNPDEANTKIDPDNAYLWRMNSRRMEAEVVRDNLLYVASDLDATMGGPDIDKQIRPDLEAPKHLLAPGGREGSRVSENLRRSERDGMLSAPPSVVPQQALAMANSELTINQAKTLAAKLSAESGDNSAAFARRAFERLLARHPKPDELKLCREFLERDQGLSVERARANLVTVLFNHNDFVTVR